METGILPGCTLTNTTCRSDGRSERSTPLLRKQRRKNPPSLARASLVDTSRDGVFAPNAPRLVNGSARRRRARLARRVGRAGLWERVVRAGSQEKGEERRRGNDGATITFQGGCDSHSFVRRRSTKPSRPRPRVLVDRDARGWARV